MKKAVLNEKQSFWVLVTAVTLSLIAGVLFGYEVRNHLLENGKVR